MPIVFDLFGEAVDTPDYFEEFIIIDDGNIVGGFAEDKITFGAWLFYRPQTAIVTEDGLRAAMAEGKPYIHEGGETLSPVDFDSTHEDDQHEIVRLFDMDGLPEGWRQAVGNQMLASKDVDAMTKLRIAAKMKES